MSELTSEARDRARRTFLQGLLATVLMSSTTAICSSAWLISPWERQAGQWQCSQWLGYPVHMLSVVVVLLELCRWNHGR